MIETKKVLFSIGEYEGDDYLDNLKTIFYSCLYSTTKLFATKPTSNLEDDIIFFT